MVVENRSGLSRIERMTSRGLADLLAAAFRSPVMSELMAAQPAFDTLLGWAHQRP